MISAEITEPSEWYLSVLCYLLINKGVVVKVVKISNLLKHRFLGRFVAIIVLISTLSVQFGTVSLLYAQEPQAETATRKVFLPLITSQESAEARSPAVILSEQEAAVEQLLLNEPGQLHPSLKLNPTLVEQARRKAQDMADRMYFDHIDPDGFGENYWVRKAGYALPDYYGTSNDANNIESIGAGYGDAEAVWNAWMGSTGHRSHLLGEHVFYREQYEYGIGFAHKENGSFGYYWVILIAKPK